MYDTDTDTDGDEPLTVSKSLFKIVNVMGDAIKQLGAQASAMQYLLAQEETKQLELKLKLAEYGVLNTNK